MIEIFKEGDHVFRLIAGVFDISVLPPYLLNSIEYCIPFLVGIYLSNLSSGDIWRNVVWP